MKLPIELVPSMQLMSFTLIYITIPMLFLLVQPRPMKKICFELTIFGLGMATWPKVRVRPCSGVSNDPEVDEELGLLAGIITATGRLMGTDS